MFLRTRAEPFVRQFGTLPTAAALVGLLLMSMGNFIVFFSSSPSSYSKLQTNTKCSLAESLQASQDGSHVSCTQTLAHTHARTHSHARAHAGTTNSQMVTFKNVNISIYILSETRAQ